MPHLEKNTYHFFCINTLKHNNSHLEKKNRGMIYEQQRAFVKKLRCHVLCKKDKNIMFMWAEKRANCLLLCLKNSEVFFIIM